MQLPRLSQQAIVSALFVLLFTGLAVALPGFRQVDNLLTLIQNVSILGILGLGMAVIVIGRGVDLSMIAALCIPPALLLQLVGDGHGIAFSLAAAIALTVAFGAINGWLIAYAEVPALFVTLASGLFLAGLGQAFFFQLETVQWPQALDVIASVGRGRLLGVPASVWMLAATLLLMAAYLRWFTLGAYVYAMGDNPQGARTAGIPTRPMQLLQYLSSALIAAFAGLVLAASLGSLSTRIFNSTLIYDVILVVVLGGIGLSGGRGGVGNVLIGTLLIGTLLNGLTILDVGYSVQNLVKGLVLLAAIVIDTLLNPRNEETAQQGDI
ncbi:MAG: ABC transporter permease [Burkholderiales bacterium]|nr:ABC transporter permease [Burkholderiales bacterium]